MKKHKRLAALFLLCALLGTVLCGCGDKSPTTGTENGANGAKDGAITVGIAQDLDDSLDPHLAVAAGTKEVLFNVFEGLLKPNADGELIPAVAASYSVSPDGKIYTFLLREGVLFHNGAAVTAEDVVSSIERCADAGNPLVPALSVIQSVEATDEKTVTITLKEANNEILSYLTLAILPKDYPDQATAPVGTGPFRFVSRVAQDSIVLEKFPEYWGTPAFLNKVTFKIVENADALVLSLQSGAIDLCAHLTAAQAAQLGDSFRVEEGTMNLVQAIYLNHKVAPFDNEKVRQAMSYAVNIDEIMDFVADGRGTPVGSSMYPAFAKYFVPELTDYYGYDPSKAKALLSEAGYPNGFRMTLTVPSNYQPHMDAAQVLAQQLGAIGITVEIAPIEWTSWISDVYTARNYSATLVGVDASNMTARAMLERFTSTAGDNFTNYSNPAYDELFAKAIASADDAEQTALYKQMETILTETAANVYLQDLSDLVAMNQKLTGYQFYPIYVMDLSTVKFAD